jgi:SAM-dependent methyltransferase
MTHPVPGAAGYGVDAVRLAAQYESITFEQVYRDLLHLLPARALAVVDVGAGSGRDAAALARRGHEVVAVEPTTELRSQGQRLHASPRIEWVDDHLPRLDSLRQTRRRFDLILLTAVWMHLDSDEREQAMAAIAEIAREGAQVFMSLRHGPVPEGRRMFDVSAADTVHLAAERGLRCQNLARREDMLGRSDVHWSFLAFQKHAAAGSPFRRRRCSSAIT